MAVTKAEIRSGAYYDSVILMQLQRSLTALPGVLDAGAVMATDANKDILAQSRLLTPAAQTAAPDDLVIVVRAEDDAMAQAALGQVDDVAHPGILFVRGTAVHGRRLAHADSPRDPQPPGADP